MTKIEWTEQTWNPIVGCSIVSPGCTNCYAMRMASRLEAMAAVHRTIMIDGSRTERGVGTLGHYVGTTQSSKGGPVWTGKLALAPERILTEPLRRRKPTMYFVNSMGDLFHEDVDFSWLVQVLAVIALTPRHTFQALTKRAAHMREMMSGGEMGGIVATAARVNSYRLGVDLPEVSWPLPNLWLGVSAERQQEADARVPDLLATPAAVRFVSAEPLLGAVDFTRLNWIGGRRLDALQSYTSVPMAEVGHWQNQPNDLPSLNWIIVGGESGHGARPMHPDWARSIRDQCQAAGVPFFFKQWGAWLPSNDQVNFADGQEWSERHFPGRPFEQHSSGHTFVNVGKSRAGRVLDGREWNDSPKL